MYSIDLRVRYSEVDWKQDMKFTSLLNYFQDCCTFQSEDLGVGIEFFGAEQAAWVLLSWHVVVERTPKMGETIRICTWPYDFGGFYGYRNFTMEDKDGTVIAYANSMWVFMDMATGRPKKIMPEFVEKYQLGEKYPMEPMPRKMKRPEDAKQMEAFVVHRSQIDTNHHVNNEKYIEMAQEYLPHDFTIRQMRAEYRKSAVLGDNICPYVKKEGQIVTVVLADEEDKPFAIVEFNGDKV